MEAIKDLQAQAVCRDPTLQLRLTDDIWVPEGLLAKSEVWASAVQRTMIWEMKLHLKGCSLPKTGQLKWPCFVHALKSKPLLTVHLELCKTNFSLSFVLDSFLSAVLYAVSICNDSPGEGMMPCFLLLTWAIYICLCVYSSWLLDSFAMRPPLSILLPSCSTIIASLCTTVLKWNLVKRAAKDDSNFCSASHSVAKCKYSEGTVKKPKEVDWNRHKK